MDSNRPSVVEENPDQYFNRQSVQVDQDVDFRQSFSQANIEKQREKFQKLRNEQLDEDEEDENSLIFQRLCTTDELKQQAVIDGDRCFISNCQKKFGYLTKKCQCKFCGHLICERHGQKHRQDPQNPSTFRRICVVCEDKYLKRMLNKEFNEKKKVYEEQVAGLEKKQKEILDAKKDKSREFESLQQRQNHDKGTFSNKKVELNNKTKRLESDIESIQQQYEYDQQKLESLKQQIEKYQTQIATQKEELDEKQKADTLLQKKISAAQKDIKATQDIVDTVERKITENNLIIEKMKISKNNQIQQQMMLQKQQQELEYQQKLQQQQLQGDFKDSMMGDDASLQSSIYQPEPEVFDSQAEKGKKKKNKKPKKSKKKKGEHEGNCGVEKCEIF